MEVNLNDWFGTHLSMLWAVLAVLFVALELLRRDKTMLVLAGGALAAMVTALFLRQAWWWQILAGLLVTIGGLVLRRRGPRGA